MVLKEIVTLRNKRTANIFAAILYKYEPTPEV